VVHHNVNKKYYGKIGGAATRDGWVILIFHTPEMIAPDPMHPHYRIETLAIEVHENTLAIVEPVPDLFED
jgi:hypothetical protein